MVSAAAVKGQRCHIRNAARSISECVATNEDRPGQGQQDDDDDDDMELLSAECDDFTSLSQLNEQQQSLSATLKLPGTSAPATIATKITASQDDKLIDVDADVAGLSKPQHQSSLQNLLAGSDDKSQHLSDIDNESFNSIDFEAEITIAGSKEQQQQETPPSTEDPGDAGEATGISTFFNNLLSHSNAGEPADYNYDYVA